MITPPLVACVILNFSRVDDTLECLRSLRASTYPNLRVWVLDYQRAPDGESAMRAILPRVEVVPLAENRGYAGNNNIGIQLAIDAGAEWVFVLNDDVVLAPETIGALIEVGTTDPAIAFLGPLVLHADEPTVIQSAGGRLSHDWRTGHIAQNQRDTGQFTGPVAVSWISGCAILARAAAVRSIGLMDERFFLYWEETEWCLRAAQAGWTIVFVPAARTWHKGVQRDYRPGPAVTYFSTRNRLLLLSTRGAPLRAWVVAWLQILRTLASWTLRPKWHAKRAHRDAMRQGLQDFLAGRFGPRPPAAP
ncbi:MAG: glycosyltransferase family 2 protein [Vicinamibacterales bacterium]